MEILYAHPLWTSFWLIIIFGSIATIGKGGNRDA